MILLRSRSTASLKGVSAILALWTIESLAVLALGSGFVIQPDKFEKESARQKCCGNTSTRARVQLDLYFIAGDADEFSDLASLKWV